MKRIGKFLAVSLMSTLVFLFGVCGSWNLKNVEAKENKAMMKTEKLNLTTGWDKTFEKMKDQVSL